MRRTRLGDVFLPAALLAVMACAPPSRPGETQASALGPDPLRRVRIEPVAPPSGPRVVPIDLPENRSFGVEPGGGTRFILAGLRVVSLLGGATLTAEDRLPGAKWEVVPLPERLGGGFLFKVDDRSVWRAEKWLGPARPIYSSNTPIARIAPGLDRVYLLTTAWHAFDGTTGEARSLGPWPASPTVSAYAAADGWRALAVADLRGAVTTSDAGATWRTLSLPIDPRVVAANGDSLEVRGPELGRGGDAAYEVRADGQVIRVGDAPEAPSPSADASPLEAPGPLGPHPLLAAVEDGWPLDDGTAIVARDGALSRVRVADGALVEFAAGAFPLRPSRCHPIALGAAGRIGFLCGEPRGATVLYAFDAAAGRLAEVRRFDVPRAVLSSGNGALAVRGPCDAHAVGDVDPEVHHYCIRTRDEAWREIRVEGAVGGERVAVLADGRFVVVSPPQRWQGTGSLTIVDGARAQTVPLTFPAVSADASRVLAVGVWLDGIEERRPGVLSGWIEAAGTMLGFELALDGKVRLGELVRGDAALPMVSGRYGLAWSVAHGGYETTNGGMTWEPVAVPEPVRALRDVSSRACGPVGCSAAGWLRIGWGSRAPAPVPSVRPARSSARRGSASLALDCEGGLIPLAGLRAGEDLLGSPPPPATSKDARVLIYDTPDTLDRAARSGPVARVFAWGPKSGEWDRAARWVVRWGWPFGGAADVRSSAAAAAPALVLDAARSGTAPGFMSPVLTLAVGDDPSHALLVMRRSQRSEQTIFELEADRAPIEIKRADGEPLGEVEAAARVSGRWYLATAASAARPGQGVRVEAVVWQIDGGTARELARIPRASAPDGRVSSARLASRFDGRALGLVVDGQPLAEGTGPTRWVAAIDLDTGAANDVELLGPFYLGEQRAISICTSDDLGWSLDVPLDGPGYFPIALAAQGVPLGALHSAFARVRLGRGVTSTVCVDRLAGSLGAAIDTPAPHTPAPPSGASITVAVSEGNDGKGRHVFRCGVR